MSVFFNMPPGEPDIIELINRAGSSANQNAQSIAATSTISANEDLYNLILKKNHRNRELKDCFKQNYSGKIYLTDHIFHAVRHIPKNSQIEFFNMQTAPEKIENSIVILSNNNVMVDNSLNKFITMYLKSPSSIFAIWDFDNHHWFSLSGMLAAVSDLYVPAHADNLEPLSRYNNIMAGPVTAGVIQWSKEFLKENFDIITKTNRSNDPLGTHIEYPQFPLRMKNLKILNKTLPNVKLVDGSYHNREMLDRFTEWCSHKSHWIVPVLNDAPIRMFDALITGGIPIVPRSLKYHRDVIDLWDHIVFYDYEDVQSPWEVTNKANQLFDSRGEQGVLDRHRLICYNHHVDNRVETILKAIEHEYGISI